MMDLIELHAMSCKLNANGICIMLWKDCLSLPFACCLRLQCHVIMVTKLFQLHTCMHVQRLCGCCINKLDCHVHANALLQYTAPVSRGLWCLNCHLHAPSTGHACMHTCKQYQWYMKHTAVHRAWSYAWPVLPCMQEIA